MQCPCNSTLNFIHCCQPAINGKSPAKTAEALMRSRYTAYAIGDAQYIFDTYATKQKTVITLANIQEGIDQNKWVKLVIQPSDNATVQNIVEFSAFYLVDSQLYEMRESSNFIKEGNVWRYVDGTIIRHEKILSVKRNDNCPCDSGKKFKKCCG